MLLAPRDSFIGDMSRSERLGSMGLKEVLESVFNNIRQEAIEPVSDGLWGVFPSLVYVAAGIAVVVLLFSSLGGRVKVTAIVVVFLVALCVPYVPQIISASLNMSSAPSAQSAQEADPQLPPVEENSPGTLSDIAA